MSDGPGDPDPLNDDGLSGAELDRRLRAAFAEARLPEAPAALRMRLERMPAAARPLASSRWSSARGLPIAAVLIVAVAILGAGLTGRLPGPGSSPTGGVPGSGGSGASGGSATPGSTVSSGPTGPNGSPLAIIPWIDATPAPEPLEPSPRPVPLGTRTCAPADLGTIAFWEGAGGSMAGGITVTNNGSAACVLDGPPKLVVIRAGAKTMDTAYTARNVSFPAGTVAPGAALLNPGDRGGWSLFWTNWCGAPLVPTSLLVTLPDGSGPILALADPTGPNPGIGSNPRCDAPGSASSLDAQAFEYQPPQPPEIVPQPASATISARPSATIGQDVAFTVTLTNLGAAPAVLDPCPIYDEGLIVDGVRLKAEGRYVLNCPAIGPSLASGAAVVLAMRYSIPSGLQPGPAELVWDVSPGGPFEDLKPFGQASIQLVSPDPAVPALTVDHPTVSVYPSTGLRDGEEVIVRVTGFGVGGIVRVSECSSANVVTGLGCGAELAAQTILVTDDSRQGSAAFAVTSQAWAGPLVTDRLRTCTTDCVIVATLGVGYGFGTAPIAFAPPGAAGQVQPTCPDTPVFKPAPTMACAAAVAAAAAQLSADHPQVVSIEFSFGTWCPPGAFCAATLPDRGYVVFGFKGSAPSMVRVTEARTTGNVTASAPEAYPPTP